MPEPRVWCTSNHSVPVNPDGSPAFSIVKPMFSFRPGDSVPELAERLAAVPVEDRCINLVNIDEHDRFAWGDTHPIRMMRGAKHDAGAKYWRAVFSELCPVAALYIDYERQGGIGYYPFTAKHSAEAAKGYAKLLSQVGILPEGHRFADITEFDTGNVRRAWVQQVWDHVANWIDGTIGLAARSAWTSVQQPELLIYETQPGGFLDRSGNALPIHADGTDATFSPRLYLDPSHTERWTKSLEYLNQLDKQHAKGLRMVPVLSPGFWGDNYEPDYDKVFRSPDDEDAALCEAVGRTCAGAIIWTSYRDKVSAKETDYQSVAIQQQRNAAAMVANAFSG